MGYRFWLIVCGIVAAFLLVFSFFIIQVVTVPGNKMAVKETWMSGVEAEPYGPKTYFLFPGWSQKMTLYDMASQVFTMNDTPTKEEKAYRGRESDVYTVQSSEGQNMRISLNVRWRRDPAKLVDLHKSYPDHVEERLLRPTVQLIVKNEATRRKAIDAFSGDGLVKLQADIQKDLVSTEGELAKKGIIVENFVIEKIDLDKEYIDEIRGRQVAGQRKLRADEETKASEAMALKAQADARADYNKRVVEAERDKQVGILAAEQDKQKKVLAAQADAETVTLAAEAAKKRVVLASEGEKDAGLNRAAGIKAVGEAEADVTKLKLSAYAVPGSDAFVKIEVAKHMAEAYGNIKGFLPNDIRINLLTDNFMRSIESIMSPNKSSPPPAK
jgi:regulator of protease activity HflC (stomatin/prohibitin superfamily)